MRALAAARALVAGRSGLAGQGAASRTRWFRVVLVTCALGAGLAVRLWVLSSHLGEIDQDEAVMGLMARHVLDGEFSVFFWGQAYGGAQEAVLTAVAFAVFGSGALTVKLVPLALYGLAAGLVWRVGRRTVGEPAATLGALLFWLGPTFFVLRSTRAYGFYGTAMVVSLAVFFVVLRLRERESRKEAALLGLLLGVGWWTTPQIVFVAVPTTVWLVARRPGMLRRAPVVAVAAVVGTSPWLALGVYGALLVAFAFAVVRRRRRAELLLVVGLAYPFLYSLSPAAFYLSEPRYLFLLSPVVALLLALALGGPLRQVLGVAAMVVLCVAGLRQINVFDPLTAASSLDPLIGALDDHRVNRLFTPYVIAQRIVFDSDERIAAAPIEYIRYPPLELTVRASPTPAYLFVRGSPLQAQFEAELVRLGVAAEKTGAGTFDLYLPSGRVLPEDWWHDARGLPFIEKAAGAPARRP